jgi:hypothetical protein
VRGKISSAMRHRSVTGELRSASAVAVTIELG